MAKKTISKKAISEVNDFVKILELDNLPIEKVVVFGSYTKGTMHKWSDIDVCIVSPKFKNSWQAIEYLWSKRVITNPGFVVEPIGFTPKDFSDNSDPLIYEIKTTGVEIPIRHLSPVREKL